MSLELELKYLLPVAQQLQLPGVLPQLATVVKSDSSMLLNAYFDTADNWFRRHDIGLRSRQKNGRFEQTIKLAGQQLGALQVRPEYNLPCRDIVPQLIDFPNEIWPENTDVPQLQQQLIELFRTDFQRQRWLLDTGSGQVELVYDVGSISSHGRTEMLSEIELELVSGSPRQLFQLAGTLIKALPLRSGSLSKAARGYYLAQNKALTLPEVQPVTDDLATLLKALQQAEAVYWQQHTAPALVQAGHLLAQIAAVLPQATALSHSANKLAAALPQQPQLFSSPDYNGLLLALAELLLPAEYC